MLTIRSFPSLLAILLLLLGVLGCSTRSGGGLTLSSGLAWSNPDPNQSAWVLLVEGTATGQASPDSPRQPLKEGTLLPAGSTVETDGHSLVVLRLPGTAGTLSLQPGSRVVLADLDSSDAKLGVFVSRGRVEGGLTAGSLHLFNSCGGSLLLSPQPGMTAPFSFGDTLPRELWDAMIGLGLNPDLLLPPLPSERFLGQAGPRTFIAPTPSTTIIPEPGPVLLALAGLAVLGGRLRPH